MGRELMPGLRRGLHVLSYLARHPQGAGFRAMTTTLADIAPSTLTRLLRTLQEEGYIERPERLYRLTNRARHFGALLSGQRSRIQSIQAAVETLARATGQSAAFFRRDGNRMILETKAEVTDSFHYVPVGGDNPRLFSFAFGLADLAWSDEGEVRALAREAGVPWTGLRKRLDAIRRAGGLTEEQERHPGLHRVVAPVHAGHAAPPEGALGISFFAVTVDAEATDAYFDAVRQAAEQLSQELDHWRENP